MSIKPVIARFNTHLMPSPWQVFGPMYVLLLLRHARGLTEAHTLHHVCRKAESSPVEAQLEIHIDVEVVRTFETWRLPTAWMITKIIRNVALRVQPTRSFVIGGGGENCSTCLI